MSASTNFSVLMNSYVKKQQQPFLADDLPFDVRINQPNKETIAAMLEAEHIARNPSIKHYSDVEEALSELKK